MKKKKLLYMGIGVFIFIIIAVILVKLYPTLELYYTAKRTGQEVVTVSDSSGNESKVLTAKRPDSPTIPPDALEEDEMSNSYSMEMQTSGYLEYTLTDVHFYDSFEESGVNPSDLMRSDSVTQLLDKYMFMVADFTITSNEAVPWYELNDGSMGFLMDVNPCELRILNGGNSIPEEVLCYFSNHPPISDTSTDYYGFTLENGESMAMQIGCLVPSRSVEDQSVCLVLGPTNLGYVYKLFD